MLLYRVLSAIVGIPVLLYLFWYGGIPLLVFISIIAGLGMLEINRLWNKMNVGMWLPGALISGILMVVSSYLGNGISVNTVQLSGEFLLGAVVFFALIINIFYLVKAYPSFTFTDMAVTVFSSLYVSWLISHLLYLRQLSSGFHFVLLVLAATWSTDTFAYFVGMNFGKRKLAPVLSPNKSIEGAVGGIFGSLFASILIGYLNPQMPISGYAVVGILIGTIGQIGDLAESALKRMAGVKDSGNIIPGHGGILDRFDSLLLTAPVAYYVIRVII